MKYFIVGFMASGKSQFAKKLGNYLSCSVYDTDEIIAKNTGLFIQDIFNQKGEEYFRNLEYQELQQWFRTNESFVMSVGGGLPCHDNLMAEMNDNGKTIYLKRPFGMLHARLIQNPGGRPLATTEKLDDLENLFKQREPIYEQASIVLDDVEKPIQQFVKLISST